MTSTTDAAAMPGGEATATVLSIVMPAYNEEQRLPSGLERVVLFLGRQPFASELIVVDDGSTDATATAVERRIAAGLPDSVTVRLLRHAVNRGKGAAIRTGMLDARGRYVFYLDADLATPPEDALRLLERLQADAPVAIGTRIQPGGSDMRATQPLQRRLAGRLYTSMRKALGVLRDIDDTQCPMKGFEHDVAREVFSRQQLSGWIFDAEVLFIARKLGYDIEPVPVTWRHVDGSRLRVRPTQALQIARDLLRLRFRHPARGPALSKEHSEPV